MWQNMRTVSLEVSQEDHVSNSLEFKLQVLEHVDIHIILDR